MKYLLLLLSLLLPVSSLFATSNEQILTQNVVKIKVYDYEPIGKNYYFSHWGSAVIVNKDTIITNAHVILDAKDEKPTGFYELCRYIPGQREPVCFTTASLVSYDTVADLAQLKIAKPTTTKGVTFSEGKLSLGSPVVVYGYPAIGGENITRTEGKIGGTEGKQFKFDGTIDRGNSGGGAFDTSGKLIGIPTAVSSDNGVIGYIIGVSEVKNFLAGKTENIEKFTTKIATTFVPYIAAQQKLFQKPNLIKTKYVEIKDVQKNGFRLFSANTDSTDASIFTYKFSDTNNRVFLIVGCSRDSATTWKNSIEYAETTNRIEQKDADSKTITTLSYLDAEKNIGLLDTIEKKETKGQKALTSELYYKNAPACVTFVSAQDGKNKDKTSYQKALNVAKMVKFFETRPITSSFISPFFSISQVQKDAYVYQGAGFFEYNDIRPVILFRFDKPRGNVSSNIDILSFDDRDGYMNYGYENSTYRGKSYRFQDFYDRYRANKYSNVFDEMITTKDEKKIIMTVIDYSDTLTSPIKYEKSIELFYPFLHTDGKYYAYKFQFTLLTDDADIHEIRTLFQNMVLPGKSPFDN